MFSHRSVLALILMMTISFVVAGRLSWLQIVQHNQLRKQADERGIRRIKLPPSRGNIYSRNLRLLATCEPSYSVWADPKTIEYVAKKTFKTKTFEHKHLAKIAQTLVTLLKVEGVSYEGVLKSLRPKTVRLKNGKPVQDQFVWIARRLDEEVINKFKGELERDKKDPIRQVIRQGTGVCIELKRVYPHGRLASAVLGFANWDNVGCYGVEKDWDETLSGKDGMVEQETDARGRPLPSGYSSYLSPKPGKSLILTLDEQIQQDAEAVLDKAMRDHRPRWAVAIVLDPKTGDILALASKPDFDPNNYRRFPLNRFFNHALCIYEPGSTIKPLVAAVSLELGKCSEHTIAVCNGIWKTSSFSVRCWVAQKGVTAHGSETLSEAIRNSCNIAMAQFALRSPYNQFVTAIHRFGLGRRLNIGAGYEEKGWLDIRKQNPTPSALRHHQATMAFGQGLAITPMQLAVGYAAIANNGSVMKPRIVKGIRDEVTGQVRWFKPQPIGRVISPLTAFKVREMLIAVVERGTGKRAKLDKVTVAGKTGTGTKAGKGGYDPTKVVVSFFGFFPADHPKWVIGVVLNEPAYGKWGGEVAAPLFAALGQRILWRVQPPRPLSLSNASPPLLFIGECSR